MFNQIADTSPQSRIDLSTKISQAVNRANLDPLKRKALVAVLVGRSVGLYLPLPSTPVMSVEAYFTLHYTDQVGTHFSKLNEASPFNVDLAFQTAKAFFAARFRAIYDIQSTLMCAEMLLGNNQGDIAGNIRLLLNDTDMSIKGEFVDLVREVNNFDDTMSSSAVITGAE